MKCKYNLIILLSFLIITSFCAVSGEIMAQFQHDELEVFLDSFFAEKLAQYNVPGAAFVVVKDGEIFFSKGYGYANLEQKIPVNPAETIFRVASVSKAFTIAAILQLADQGLVNLTADVNEYLKDWQLNSSPYVVQVRDLLTHTDGFETRDLKTFALAPPDLLSLGEVLQRELKRPVQKPGTMVTYGGYGTALAGYIVEQVSGQNFEEYVKNNLFVPLEMNNSSFYQELPPQLSERVALVYDYEDRTGEYEPLQFLYVHTPPTGGLSCTPNDLARFLIDLLNGNKGTGSQILTPTSIEQIFTQQYSAHAHLPGVSFGFMEYKYNGQKGLIRDGSGVGIRSQIYLLPEHNMGFFYVQNTRGDELIDELNDAFLDRYFATAKGQPTAMSDTAEGLKKLAGTYRPTQTAEHTLVKIESLLIGELKVKTTPEGYLEIATAGMGDVYGGFFGTTHWVQTAPGYFQRLDKERYLAFQEDIEGKTVLFSGSGYHGSYYKIKWYESSMVQLLLLGFYILIFIITPVISLVQWVIRRKNRHHNLPKKIKRVYVLANLVCILNVIGIVGALYLLFIKRIAAFPAFAFGASPGAIVMLFVLMLAAILTIPLAIMIIFAHQQPGWSILNRIYYTFMVVCALGFVLWINYWNLLGIKI